ncbi:ATP synthase F1 subunit epsilon [Patescibacteria group bacterium]|nr:ATP synthase F1 subunit epsilon [Patescibacteria group bacterium]MBU1967248.1 ATP synthase F1 subunit epsilon [Patescibacteria group bacterium]MBU2543590.1 ATP synthase F1 subunit epsilon [Patescibacteria group bacterium]
MSNKLSLDVISQEQQLLSQEVDMVLVPSMTGQIGILPGHISLFASLEAGELILTSGTRNEVFAITGGFLDVNQNQVTVLADSAIRAEDIDINKVEEAKKRAQEAMKDKSSEKDFKLAEADLRKAILELKVAKRRRHSTLAF